MHLVVLQKLHTPRLWIVSFEIFRLDFEVSGKIHCFISFLTCVQLRKLVSICGTSFEWMKKIGLMVGMQNHHNNYPCTQFRNNGN
jgi:hypothetical protein